MNDPWNEDERLAAFVDGRLGERERAEMLAHLTADDDAFEVFAGLAAILRRAEVEDAGAGAPVDEGGASVPAGAGEPVHEGVISLEERARARADRLERGEAGRRAKQRVSPLGWTALAAVLAGVAVVTGPALRARTSAAGEPVRVAARLEHAAEGLPPGWPLPWSSPRGDGATAGGSPEERAARAARAGALLVDLSVAVQARDAERTRLLAGQIASRFDRHAGRGGALRKIADGAGSPPAALQPLLVQATHRIAKRGDRDALQVGAWVEAARLAAATHDAAFFRDNQTQRILWHAARLTASAPSARAALQRVRLLLPGAGPPRWEELAAALEALAGEIASG
ncbi:MAG TPA: hypothetical protein VGO40_16265 [Longimicrobium sp.]|nr:hypothetical protein [Longimicrobium sp.]